MDSIIAENPNKTLDELLEARKINADQKAQAQKKPALQASLAQLEEQITQYKQFDTEYQKRLSAEKAALETSHSEELEKVKATTVAEAHAEAKKETKESLLALSKFLRAAAAKRQDGDDTSEENRAFEGALLLVYGGDANAVIAMEKLIDGSEEKVPYVDGQISEFTCKPTRLARNLIADIRSQSSILETLLPNTPRRAMLLRKHGSKKLLNLKLLRRQRKKLHHRRLKATPLFCTLV